MAQYSKRPQWLRLKPLNPYVLAEMGKIINNRGLHTVCESTRCPNRTECFSNGTATFMILGDICTRNCSFCAVKHGTPISPDSEEPEHVVAAIKELGLRYIVITSVTRDDLLDGGAYQFALTLEAIYHYNPSLKVELLIPDLRGSDSALRTVIDAHPLVLSHNIETVPRLYSKVRKQARYQRSLQVLRKAKEINNKLLTKSGIMVGLGESPREVIEVMLDLRAVGCDLLTIGQYLQPSLRHHGVVRYVPPEEFEEYRLTGEQLGFRYVLSGPLVRSSLKADVMYLSAITGTRRPTPNMQHNT